MSQFPALVGAALAFWEDIDEQTLGAPAASVSFTGIGSTFTFLRVTGYLTKDGSSGGVFVRLNNDSAANYDRQRITASAAVVTGQRATTTGWLPAQTGIRLNEEANLAILIAKPVTGEEAQAVMISGTQNAAANFLDLGLQGGQWNNTAALISRVDLVSAVTNFDADTRVLLEGGAPA